MLKQEHSMKASADKFVRPSGLNLQTKWDI